MINITYNIPLISIIMDHIPSISPFISPWNHHCRSLPGLEPTPFDAKNCGPCATPGTPNDRRTTGRRPDEWRDANGFTVQHGDFTWKKNADLYGWYMDNIYIHIYIYIYYYYLYQVICVFIYLFIYMDKKWREENRWNIWKFILLSS